MRNLPDWASGIGLRAPHYAEFLERRPDCGFIEVHGENFFHAGGAAMAVLEAVREQHPVSLHGTGLTLGSACDAAPAHCERLSALVKRIEPALVSEHMCWGAWQGGHMADLLPLPCTTEALDLMCERVDALQETLGRQVLIENVTAYVRFAEDSMSDTRFLGQLARRTGCGLLLDLNNLYVNARNHGFDATEALLQLPRGITGEIHIAGHERIAAPGGREVLVDTHGSAVCPAVWDLLRTAIGHLGPVPVLVERDQHLPALDTLLDEARQARELMLAPESVHV